MTGNHPLLAFDLCKLARQDEMRRANKQRLVAEAKEGRGPRAGMVTASRRIFGGAIINLGQAVHGERLEQIEGPAVSTATLRMAR
jgi:hypothetical protein